MTAKKVSKKTGKNFKNVRGGEGFFWVAIMNIPASASLPPPFPSPPSPPPLNAKIVTILFFLCEGGAERPKRIHQCRQYTDRYESTVIALQNIVFLLK